MEPLKRGRSAARENPKIGPAPQALLDAVLPNLSRPVGAIVDLQLLTGARAGELLQLRRCDIEIDDKTGVWAFRPDNHKNMYREHEHRRIGGKTFTAPEWREEFGRKLAEDDTRHFDLCQAAASQAAAKENRVPRRRAQPPSAEREDLR